MRTLFTAAALLTLICSAVTAQADGLFYQLPEDGSWVEYKVDATEINPDLSKHESSGTLTVSSVGAETVEGEKCRWIEFKLESRQDNVGMPTNYWKMLIPETQLLRGQAPVKHIVRVWSKRGDGPLRLVDRNRMDILQLYLMGPPEPEKKFAPQEIESGLGKLKCEGVSGQYLIEPFRRDDISEHGIKSTFTTRLHPLAPFGVVWTTLDAQADDASTGKAGERTMITLRLQERGTDATSDLPDAD